MPPTTKDSDTAGPPGDSTAKPQPVALEVPITVNGARTIEGSDKREPCSESTKTVMVHGSGAIIRLNSSMAPGQLLFLTNERTKKEVVCQVVKSKNYRSVSGYVELEFTEPAVGFWGMRFPGDRSGPGPQAAPAAQKTEPSVANVSSSISVKPSAPVRSKPAPPAPAPSIVPAPMDSASLLGAPKAKADSRVPAAPVVSLLDADEPLVEPWLKKREPTPRPPAAPARVAAPEPVASPLEPQANLSSPVRNFELTRPSDKPASLFAPSEEPANPLAVDLCSIARFFEVKTAPTEHAPAPPQATGPPMADDSEAEDLKQQTGRLQEELSKMQFAETTSAEAEKDHLALKRPPEEPEVETPSFPLSEQSISTLKTELQTESVHDSAVRLVEHGEPSQEISLSSEAPELEEPLKVEPAAPIPALGSLGQEEMKIPAWLAPLAAPVEEKQVAGSRVPQFGSALPFDEGAKAVKESAPSKSGKGMLFAGLAAGILLLAGGGWRYMNQQAAGVHSSAGASQAVAVSAPSGELQTNVVKESALETAVPGRTDSGATDWQAKTAAGNSNEPFHSVSDPSSSAPASQAGAARNPQVSANSSKEGNAAASVASTAPDAEPVQEKKPVLGEVHLAAPKVSQKRTVQRGTEPDEGILNQDQPESSVDSAGTGLGMTSNQPAAPESPVAVGGDVQQAKLISSVPPVYPTMAKAQHISGGVTMDALIDANGRVTTMKVISGPTPLQQAAMEALKQWKYQPAMLDGKAVPMHLTVTIQFKVQQ